MKLKIHKDWKNIVLLLAVIILFAFLLRIFKLTSLPIFGDEAIYIRWAQVMRVEPTLRFVPLSDGKQPLFMWCVIPFLKIFSDPLFAGRLVSVVTGLGSLVGIFTLAHLLFNDKKSSLIAAIIYAISPYSIFYDRLALVDSMLTMFGVWAFVFAVITVKKTRLDSAMLAGFALGGALLTKSPAIFFALLIPSVLLLAKWPKKNLEKFNKLSVFIFLFAFTYAIGLGLYNILRLGPNFHMIAIRNKDYVYPLTHLFQSPLDPLRPFLDRALSWFWKLGPSVFIFLVVIGILQNLRKKPKEVLLLTAWAFIPLIINAEFAKVFTARYILFIFPYLAIIASLSLKNANKLAKFLVIFFVLHALWINFQLLTNVEKTPLPRVIRSGYLEEWTAGTGIRGVSLYLKGEYRNNPDEKIVVGTEGYFGTLPDGLQIYLNDVPEITVIGTGIDFTETPIQLIESARTGNKTYFVVNSTRLLADPDKLGLELIDNYPKAIRPDGSLETLYLFGVVDNSSEEI